jgi:hypothetical protein
MTDSPDLLERHLNKEKHEERRAWKELKDRTEKRLQLLEEVKMREEDIGGA